MIGAPVQIGSIVQDPPGIVMSNYYGYNGTYQNTSTLNMGEGYWVKCSAPGSLTLAASFVATGRNNPESGGDDTAELNVLKFSPVQNGKKKVSQSLLFGSSIPHGKTADSYALPPSPPGGLDVRFASDRMAEFLSAKNDELKEIPFVIQSPSSAVTVSWSLQERDGQLYILTEKENGNIVAEHRLVSDDEVTLTDVEKKTFSLRVESKPAAFALSQNYPNPFNPTTTIRYELPIQSNVAITVYTILGQQVATLVDGIQPEGFHSASFNANGIASGIYFYKMSATGVTDPSRRFTAIRRMMLIK